MSLTRRQFLLGGLGAGAAGAAGLVVARQPWATRPAGRPVTNGPAGAAAGGGPAGSGGPAGGGGGKDGILVLLTLYGGNDGLNTLIPYQEGAYLGGRSQLGYQPEQVLPLAEGLALHPNMAGLKGLWDQKKVAIVRGVGYPNPNRSHFRSMDIWQSGVPDAAVSTGWVGRWLDGVTTAPKGSGGTAAAAAEGPLQAVSVGGTLPRVFAGEKAAGAAVPVGQLTLPGSAGVTSGFAALSAPTAGASPLAARAAQVGSDLLAVDHAIADMLASHPDDAAATASSAGGLDTGGGGGAAGQYGGGTLDSQLALVARLVKAGSPTRVYGVNLGGFDTHANEKDTHARLMGEIDKGVTGFFGDLGSDPAGQRVTLVAYSEFGRRVAANASGGTDHGTAAPVFVVGPRVKGGFYGDEPSLTDLDAGDLKFTTDFRSVYATVLQEVLGVDAKMALGKPFPPIPFL